jgi:hypothetical protein
LRTGEFPGRGWAVSQPQGKILAELAIHFAGGQGAGQGRGFTDVLAGGVILVGQGVQQEAVVEGARVLGEGRHHSIAAPQGFC